MNTVKIESQKLKAEKVNRSSPGVSNLWPVAYTCPRMAVNVARQKIVNLLKTL